MLIMLTADCLFIPPTVLLLDSTFCLELLIGLLLITTVFPDSLTGNAHHLETFFFFYKLCYNSWLGLASSKRSFSCSAMDEDISRLKTTAVGLLGDLGCNGSTLTEDLINEMCRFGAAELHAVAAFIGGIASQEVIKVLFSSSHCLTYWFACC